MSSAESALAHLVIGANTSGKSAQIDPELTMVGARIEGHSQVLVVTVIEKMVGDYSSNLCWVDDLLVSHRSEINLWVRINLRILSEIAAIGITGQVGGGIMDFARISPVSLASLAANERSLY